MEFKHPKYYKELRKRNKSDQAISNLDTREVVDSVRPDPGLKPQAASAKPQAPSESSNKPQASSPKQQASSSKPQASSSKILWPRKSFTVPEPRCSTKMNELLGCFTWKLIWCGEKRTLLLRVTFSSTVKNCWCLLYPSRSGRPGTAKFSIRFQHIVGVFFFKSSHNFLSGFNVTTSF